MSVRGFGAILTCALADMTQNLFVHDESAHPAGDAEAAGSARGTMMEWVRKIQVWRPPIYC